MNRLLLDQGLAPDAARFLRQEGFDAVHVSEMGLERAEDIQILEIARRESRVCITLDHDFHSHLAASRNGRPSVVLLRVQSIDGRAQADLIRSVCVSCEEVLSEGAAVSANGKTIRVRRLPLR